MRKENQVIDMIRRQISLVILKGLKRELSHVYVIFVSFQGHSDLRESPFL